MLQAACQVFLTASNTVPAWKKGVRKDVFTKS